MFSVVFITESQSTPYFKMILSFVVLFRDLMMYCMCVSAAAFVIASAPGAFRAVYSVGAMCVTRASMHSSVDGFTATIAPVARGRSSTHSRWVNAELHIQASLCVVLVLLA